jgi:TIR domain
MSEQKAKLFLSHATEDQASIAEPLNKILSQSYKIYYFPESIIPGQSQFESISQALNECDYGVVILSPDYLRKYWTRSELYALWARRMIEGRDVIIPVWWNVTVHDVKSLSPLLLDPNAITAATPAEIAQRIAIAVGGALKERKRWDQKLRLAESIRSKRAANATYSQLVYTEKGSALVWAEWQQLKERCQKLKEQYDLDGHLTLDSKDAAYLRFISVSSGGFSQAPYNTLALRFDLIDLADNSIASAKLQSSVRLEYRDGYSQRVSPAIVTDSEFEFVPKFDEQAAVVWEKVDKELRLTMMIADEGFEIFQRFLDRRLGGHSLNWRASTVSFSNH